MACGLAIAGDKYVDLDRNARKTIKTKLKLILLECLQDYNNTIQ